MKFVGKMVWNDEVGPVHFASGMPAKIVKGAQYMNDAMGSVFGKLTQAVNNQKSTEFRGGIWDCSSVEETLPSEPSCMDTSNNSAIKTYSLDEMLLTDDECATCDDAEMKDDELRRNAELSDNAACTDVSDVNNKRWRSEEFDKASLLTCNDSETTRKKPKKTVSFSDVVVDLEDASKSASKISKFITLDVAVVKDDTCSTKETVSVKENGKRKNSVVLISEHVSDVPIKMVDKVSALTKKSKESKKVQDWRKLISQSSEIDHDQHIPVKAKSSNKLTCERHRSKSSLSDDIVENQTVSKRIVDKQEVKNRELMNRNHLEIAIPELFECSESKTAEKADPRSVKKNVKDKLKSGSDDLTSIRNLALEIKKTSQSSKKNSNAKSSHSHSELNLSKNEIKSKNFKEDFVSNEMESNEDCLKNSLLKMFNDSDIVESLTIQLKELAEQNKRNIDVTEKEKIMADDKELDPGSMIRQEKLPEDKSVKEQTYNRSKSEDESQCEMENSPILKECCPPVCDKPSCNQQTLQKDRKIDEDFVKVTEINASLNRADYKSGNVSPTSYQVEKNYNPPVSHSRSDSCSNWRSQCIDVQLKDAKESIIPQRSGTVNWRDDFSNPKSQPSRPNNHKTRRVENFKKMLANKMDVLSKTEYEGDDMVVVPIYLKEPPEPSSRFKDITADPESIWDTSEETTRPSHNTCRIQTPLDFDMKNNSEAEEVHAQLFRKTKITSVPRFFDNPAKPFTQTKAHEEICEDVRQSSVKKIGNMSSGMLNGNYRSRSQSRRENFNPCERNRSSSLQWRSSLAVTSLEQDIHYIVKIKNLQDGSIEKLKILKDDFLLEVRENSKLLDIIPFPGHKPRKIDYSACAVKMFVRCLFYPSYEIPSCITALEGFALGKKFGVENLKTECEAHFTNYTIPSEEIQLVSACAHQLQAVEALKSSKYFQKVQYFKSVSAQNMYSPQSCIVSCSVLVDPSEFVIPLTSTASRGLESCNESDVRNRLSFTSLAQGTTLLSGIQLKFLTEDNPQLKIICEVFQTKRRGNAEKLFYQELDKRAQSSVKIPFEDEISVKYLEEIEIVVYIEDVLLKICPQLTENELVRQGKFRTKFESSKSSKSNRRLFCIEKMFYTQAP